MRCVVLSSIGMMLAMLPLAFAAGASGKTIVSLGTATPGGGFPVYGEAVAATINEIDPTLEVKPQNTMGSAENVPHAGSRQARHRAGAGRGGARGLQRHRPAAGGPAHPVRHVRDARHVRRARRQPLSQHRRPQGQAGRLRRQGLGAGAACRLHARRARARSRPRLPGDLSRPRRRRAGDGARRQGGGAVGRRHGLAGLHRGCQGRRPLHRARRRRASSASRPSIPRSRR